MTASSVDLSPLLPLALTGVTVALPPLGWWWLRHRGAPPSARWYALVLLTLFVTFDLVLFGAFTRLTDSGLGCPDWPGCYGSTSPVGAHVAIQAAQSAMPTGPVTLSKAWVEMVHRYLAGSVGVLITVLAIASWVQRWRRGSRPADHLDLSPAWATAALVWVCLQGAFGAWTVTMKLYPAIVTGHLLGGIGLTVLLALLAVKGQSPSPDPLPLSSNLLRGTALVGALAVLQVTLGAWVSTNYAVLVCSDFPTCQGSWWPTMDFADAFTLLRPLGMGRHGEPIPFTALTAIHVVHRIGAAVLTISIALLVWRLFAQGDARLRGWAGALGGAILWQLATGMGNVVLGWPLAAAVAHTGGAAVLVTLIAVMLARSRSPGRSARPWPAAGHAQSRRAA